VVPLMLILHLVVIFFTEKSLRDALGATITENILLVLTPARIIWSIIPDGEILRQLLSGI